MESALVRLARVTRVEAHKRRSVTGETEHVDSYLRKIRDHFEGGDAKTKRAYYHVAPQSARESIETYGLDTTRGKSPFVGFYQGYPKGNYLYPSASDSQLFAAGLSGMVGSEADIWEVDTDGLDLQDDPLGVPEEWQGGAKYVTDPIPPRRLRRL